MVNFCISAKIIQFSPEPFSKNLIKCICYKFLAVFQIVVLIGSSRNSLLKLINFKPLSLFHLIKKQMRNLSLVMQFLQTKMLKVIYYVKLLYMKVSPGDLQNFYVGNIFSNYIICFDLLTFFSRTLIFFKQN